MDFNVLRHRIARRLHGLGVHWFCRVRRETKPLVPVSFRRDDGTVWTPDLNGVMGNFTTSISHY